MREIRESSLVFLRLRKVFGAGARARPQRESSSKAFDAGRDPNRIGSVLSGLASGLGWDDHLVRARVVAEWDRVVGENVAAHTSPVFESDELVVYCESTAWASNLRIMRSSILARLAEEFPSARIERIHLKGPDAPSWKKGIRSVPGRGPRDTYG